MRKHRDLKDIWPSIVHIQHKQVRNITGILISCSCVSFWLPSPRISFLSPSLPSSNFFVLLVSRGGYTVHTFVCNITRFISVRLSVHLRICRAVVRFGRQEYNGTNGYQLEYGPEIQTVTEEVIKQLHDPVNPLVNTPHPPAQFEHINNVRKQHGGLDLTPLRAPNVHCAQVVHLITLATMQLPASMVEMWSLAIIRHTKSHASGVSLTPQASISRSHAQRMFSHA